MAANIDKAYQDKMVAMTKMCMKGKNMHICIQAAGAKKGKLILAKKQSECKPKVIKALKIFSGGKEADALNDIKAPPAMGVAVGQNGTLKIMIEKGPEKDKIAEFAKYFITKQMKLKLVKDVELVQVEEGKLPAVSDDDDDDGGKVKAPAAASQAAASKPKPAAAPRPEAEILPQSGEPPSRPSKRPARPSTARSPACRPPWPSMTTRPFRRSPSFS